MAVEMRIARLGVGGETRANARVDNVLVETLLELLVSDIRSRALTMPVIGATIVD